MKDLNSQLQALIKPHPTPVQKVSCLDLVQKVTPFVNETKIQTEERSRQLPDGKVKFKMKLQEIANEFSVFEMDKPLVVAGQCQSKYKKKQTHYIRILFPNEKYMHDYFLTLKKGRIYVVEGTIDKSRSGAEGELLTLVGTRFGKERKNEFK